MDTYTYTQVIVVSLLPAVLRIMLFLVSPHCCLPSLCVAHFSITCHPVVSGWPEASISLSADLWHTMVERINHFFRAVFLKYVWRHH